MGHAVTFSSRVKRARPFYAGRLSKCAALVQLVRTLVCGTRGPPFDPGRRYQRHSAILDSAQQMSAYCYCSPRTDV